MIKHIFFYYLIINKLCILASTPAQLTALSIDVSNSGVWNNNVQYILHLMRRKCIGFQLADLLQHGCTSKRISRSPITARACYVTYL